MSQLPGTTARPVQTWAVRENYKAVKSKFGPAYKIAPNYHGLTFGRIARAGTTATYFGAAAGIFVFFMFAEIPRMRKDISEKLPIVGPWFHVEIPPEDNPF